MKIVPQYHLESILNQVKFADSESFESEVIEFKEYNGINALHNSKELAEELTAFANHHGGTVIIGIRDGNNVPQKNWESQLVGFEVGDVTEIKSRIRGKIQSQIVLEVEYILFEGKSFLVINIDKTRDSLATTTSGKVYIRDGRSSRPMSPDEIEMKVKSFQKYDWTGESLDIDVLNSLEPQAVREALDDFWVRREKPEALTTQGFLEAIEATKNGKLTRAGLLFLGKAEVIKAELGDYEYRFTWKDKGGNLIINDVWSSCLWMAIKRISTHFSRCNSSGIINYQSAQYNVNSIDQIAFHEAYVNGLVHRDYSIDGMVTVNFTGNKLLITSPGKFYGGITVSNIGLHEPRHRNKALARILMSFHLVDRAGMGVPRMGIHSLKYGRKFPVFREDFDSVEVAMDAEFIIPSIFALTAKTGSNFGLSELLVLNLVYAKGFYPLKDLLQKLKTVDDQPWEAVSRMVDKNPMSDYIELCGDKKDIYIRVKPNWLNYFEIDKPLKVKPTSDRYVNLYKYLQKHGEASNADLLQVIGYSYPSKVSEFLNGCEFVRKKNSGYNSSWVLNYPSSHKR